MEQAPKVYLLLMHAWGMGGTIRATLNLAAQLSERHEVEVLSVVRRRDEPFFAFPPGVAVTAIDDQRPHRLTGAKRLLRWALRGRRSRLVDRADRAARACSAWTDVQLWRTRARIDSGVLVGTRPALNLLIVRARPGVIRIGQEHMHLTAHPPALRAAIARGYGGLDALAVLTPRDRDDYRAMLGEAVLIACLPNAVPASHVPPSSDTAPVILAAGRLTRQKGFDRLVRAFAPVAARHPEWTLRICGGGPKGAALHRLVEELQLQGRVELPGRIGDMAAERSRASVFALSSRFEGLPMVLLEAMASGLAVVAFDCPTGPGDVIDHGRDGLLVAEGDVPALTDALIAVVEDAGLRRALGAAAAQKATAYAPATIAASWEALFAQAHPATRATGTARPSRPDLNVP
jgi:glycosyltransferase involved in cell wall biosynthesis